MKKLILLSLSLLLLSCSENDNTPPDPVDFTYSVEGLLSFTKDGVDYKIPIYSSVSYGDASGEMVADTITDSAWEKTIKLIPSETFIIRLLLKHIRLENPNDDPIYVKLTHSAFFFLDGELLGGGYSNTSSTTMTTNELNEFFATDVELAYYMDFD